MKNGTAIRRRRRAAKSCILCRRRKVKCDKELPCNNCILGKAQCIYRTFNDDIVPGEHLLQDAPRAASELNTPRPPPSSSGERLVIAQAGLSPASHPLGPSGTPRAGPQGENLQSSVRFEATEVLPRDITHRSSLTHVPTTSKTLQRDEQPTRGHDPQVVLNKTRLIPWSQRMGTGDEVRGRFLP
jgi:hypothetical protein